MDAQNHKWYDVDFKDVIKERKRYYDESNNYKMIASDIRDSKWLSEIKEVTTAIIDQLAEFQKLIHIEFLTDSSYAIKKEVVKNV